MKKNLLILSFIEGATVMAAELCGAKLLAPIFGSSLFVWASVMGITLAALAGGYFFGGYLSHKKENKTRLLFQLLNLAALFVLLMPLISAYLVMRISYLPFLTGVVLSTKALLLLPVFFLGATSPVFIALQTTTPGTEGKVSGTVYAVSTLGGIVATFLCGFYVIPELGLNMCLLIFGGSLFLANILVFKFFKTLNFFLFVSLLYLNLQFKINSPHSIYNRDGIYGNLKVEDAFVNASQKVRYLMANGIPQSEMDLHTRKPVAPYVILLDSLIAPAAIQGERALMLGLGGGLMANILAEKKYITDAVELDKRVIDIAKRFFYLDKNVNTIQQDARYFLNHCERVYDVIVIDLFKGEELPGHVLTLESLNALKKNLSPGAKIYINWHGYLRGDIGLGTSIIYNTFISCGYNVKLCSNNSDEPHRNMYIIASLNDLNQIPFELSDQPGATSLLNTDDKPLLEKYNIEATKSWRVNYLRYYQGN